MHPYAGDNPGGLGITAKLIRGSDHDFTDDGLS
jgi:hypothetical protein